jgi:hypothetical protein
MLTRQQAIDRIKSQGGKIFSVRFIKRTTGEERKMVCRLGVKSHLKGGTLAYNPSEKALLTVFDVQKQDYRSINLDQLLEVAAGGEIETVTGE